MRYTTPLLLLLSMFAACTEKNDAISEQGPIPEDYVPIRTTKVIMQSSSIAITSTGIISSSSEQRLSFKIGGIIKKVYVEEGDVVKPGQLLAAMDKTEIDAQVKQAQEALTKSERDLARATALYQDSSATLELLQNATSARDVAIESMNIAKFNQRFAEIRATKPGKVIKKLINEGEITGPGLPCFVIFGTSEKDWIVQVSVSDRDWASLRLGMPAKINLDAYENTSFNGKVSDLAPAADPTSGLYPIEIQIASQGKRLAPGLFATVEIMPSKSRPYAEVPIEAIVEGDGNAAFVFVLQADQISVKKTPVKIAFMEGDRVLLSSGLEAEMEVVTAGAPYLSEKKKVLKVE